MRDYKHSFTVCVTAAKEEVARCWRMKGFDRSKWKMVFLKMASEYTQQKWKRPKINRPTCAQKVEKNFALITDRKQTPAGLYYELGLSKANKNSTLNSLL